MRSKSDPMYALPPSDSFKGPFGEKLDFCPADDLRDMADDLTERHNAKFSHLPQLHIQYLWKREGGTKSGKLTLGKAQRPSGLLAYYSKADFVIWLAWDHAITLKLEERQVEAALFHEMCHLGVSSEDGETPELWPHDVEMFADEVRTYGLWRSDLECLRQLGLFERVDRETGEVLEPAVAAAASRFVGEVDKLTTRPDGLRSVTLSTTIEGQTESVTIGPPRGTHYHDDNPARPPLVCRDPDCTLDHHPIPGEAR